MYRCRSWCYSKHGYPVKKYQCRNENFGRWFSIVRETEESTKNRKKCFDLWFDYMHFNKCRSLFLKKPGAYQSNFIGARSVQHAATSKSVADNCKSGEDRNTKVSHPRYASDRSKLKGHDLATKKKIKLTYIFPKNPSFNCYLTACVDRINESFHASGVLETETSPVTVTSDLDSTGDTNSKYKLCRDPETDENLYQMLLNSQESHHFMEMAEFAKKLPIFEIKDDFLNLLGNNQVVIVSGSTGCGKSTQLVQYVLDDFILSKKGSLCNIICIVPRRVCATSLAARVSQERQDSSNYSVGYQIRFQKNLSKSKRGCINFVTTGIFLDMLQGRNSLSQFSHIFIDEIHERSIECDTILALLKERLNKIPNTKIILMSGTINPSLFSEYMSGAPHIETPGFLYPVEEYYLEDVLRGINFKFGNKKFEPLDQDFTARVLPYVRSIKKCYPPHVITELSKPISEKLNYGLAAKVIEHIINKENGGCILIFLPGINDILFMNEILLSQPWYSSDKLKTLWMHSSLSNEEQQEIFEPTPKGTWKIIISTSILETSVTVTDVKYVIDAGKTQRQSYNLDANVKELKPVWISQSNARQRKGRAGRVREGVCIKLYTRGRERCFSEYPIPEFRSTSVEGPFIKAKCYEDGCARKFFETLLDPPETAVVNASVKNLQEIDVLDFEENLTPLGKHVAEIPFPPQLCKLLLLGAIFRCFDPISSIVAVLAEKKIFSNSRKKKNEVLAVKETYDENDLSDHLICSRIIRDWELSEDRDTFLKDNMLSRAAMCHSSMLKRTCGQILHRMNFLPSFETHDMANNTYSENKNLVKAILCGGLYPNIAFERFFHKRSYLKSLGRCPIMFGSGSICSTSTGSESPFFAYYGQILRNMIFISDATMINPLPLILFCNNFSLLGYDKDSNSEFIMLDNIIRVRIPRQTLNGILKFRQCLRQILNLSYRNPGALDALHSTVMPDLVDLLSLQQLKCSRDP